MLAYPVSAKPIDYSKPVFIQPKLDGVRCVIQYEKVNSFAGEVKAYSRTGKEWKNIDHILFNLTPFFHLNPDVVLDGELYNHDFKDNFEQIISMVRKTKPTDQDRLKSRDNVQFHCYDIVREDIPFNERNYFISKYVKPSYCVKHVHTMRISSHENALALEDYYRYCTIFCYVFNGNSKREYSRRLVRTH